MLMRKVPSQRRTGGMWGKINQLPIPQQKEVVSCRQFDYHSSVAFVLDCFFFPPFC